MEPPLCTNGSVGYLMQLSVIGFLKENVDLANFIFWLFICQFYM